MNLAYSRRTCPTCGVRISSDANACRKHWQDGMSPRRFERRNAAARAERHKNRPPSALSINDAGNEVRANVSLNMATRGVMHRCRSCSKTCKQYSAVRGSVPYCPALPKTPEIERMERHYLDLQKHQQGTRI